MHFGYSMEEVKLFGRRIVVYCLSDNVYIKLNFQFITTVDKYQKPTMVKYSSTLSAPIDIIH